MFKMYMYLAKSFLPDARFLDLGIIKAYVTQTISSPTHAHDLLRYIGQRK